MSREYYIDPLLKKNLDAVKPHVLKNWDMCFIVSGIEGAGKSTFAFQIADQLSGERFTLDHICLTPKDFTDKITQHDFLKPGDSLVLDEGFMINSRSSMTKLNREFLAILSECRQKQLFLIIICPNFFDLDKNLALWRSRGLFYIDHVGLRRGYFKFWSYDRKKKLYVLGKKFYEYHKVKYDFRGTFPKQLMVDEVAYKAIKLHAFENREELTLKDEKVIDERNFFIYLLHEAGVGWTKMAEKGSEFGFKMLPDTLFKGASRFLSERKRFFDKHTKEGFMNPEPTPLLEKGEGEGERE